MSRKRSGERPLFLSLKCQTGSKLRRRAVVDRVTTTVYFECKDRGLSEEEANRQAARTERLLGQMLNVPVAPLRPQRMIGKPISLRERQERSTRGRKLMEIALRQQKKRK